MVTTTACSSHNSQTTVPALPRILPFAVFMGFIALEEALQWLNANGFIVASSQQFLFLYPLKAVATVGVLYYFRNSYSEICWRDLARMHQFCLSVVVGILVFILWINMDWHWATLGTTKGYDPTNLSVNSTRFFLISSRLIGASIIVPVMEELFWRSWLLRYLINENIAKVPLGTFTWLSFCIGTVMFGLEHNLWLAGIMAGVAYSLLLYRTKSLTACILAHMVTNGILGGYVLWSGKWEFW